MFKSLDKTSSVVKKYTSYLKNFLISYSCPIALKRLDIDFNKMSTYPVSVKIVINRYRQVNEKPVFFLNFSIHFIIT